MSNRSLIDRYRWWLFLGSFAIQILASSTASISIWVALGISIIAAISFLSGLAGFIAHAQRRRKESAAAEEQS